MTEWTKFLTSLSYTTIIPVNKTTAEKISKSEHNLNGLAKYLPLIGLIIGICLTLEYMVLKQYHINNVTSSLLITIFWLTITGGLHFDGLMDTADGIFAHQNTEKTLEIMKDSRVGNFGVLTGIIFLLIKITSLINLQPKLTILALLLLPLIARYCELYAIGKFKYLRNSGAGKIWHDTTTFTKDQTLGMICIFMTTGACILHLSINALYLLPLTLSIGIFTGHALNKILGGHTGDTYGAVVEITESIGLLLANMFLN